MSAPVHKDELRAVRALYDCGLYVQAWRCAESLGPLRSWRGTDARLLAGRLAGNLGAPRLARALHYRAWKEDPQHPEAAYYQAREIILRRGPLVAWEMQEQYGDLSQASPQIQADFFALRGFTLARLRDFDAAESWLAKAEALAPKRAWIHVERAGILELEDRLDEALVAARRALELRPWYRPAVQAAARVLGLAGRENETIELLTGAAERTECFGILTQLAAVQREQRHYAEALATLDRAVEWAPMLEDELREWLTCLRADAAYLSGDCGLARDLAGSCQSEFFQTFAQRLGEPERDRRRVHLPVGFVRQHRDTCAPATLASLTRYWAQPAEHLEVAAEICYDGTPQHRLRDWAERHGWVVREFTVTWDDVVALIDRGVPFALTVSRPGQAHLQAIIGYDRLRETWLVRDPGEPFVLEAGVDSLLAHHRFSGPPGMALVPAAEAARLDGLTLTDQALYDRLHQLGMALHVHDRPSAQQQYDALCAEAPAHRLTHLARMTLARYDGDVTTHLHGVEQLLEMFPGEPQLLLFKLHGLRELGRRADRLELLEELLAQPDCDPLFQQEYAHELSSDARHHDQAAELLRATLRMRPYLAGCMACLGHIYWQQRRFDAGLALYRFALCAEDKDEDHAQAYFGASRHLRKEEESIALLRSRYARFGASSGRPARTLFWAYDSLERTREGFALLTDAMTRRPQDGDLLLFTAAMHGAYGRFKEARRLLELAEPRSQRTTWLRTAANLARARGRLKQALAMWREVLTVDPLAVDAHSAVARLLEATEGRPAALHHLEAATQQFPHSCPLHQLWIQWLRDEELTRAEQAIRHLLDLNPADAWAHRELALTLSHQQRLPEALAQAELAVQLAPNSPQSQGIYGHIALKAGQRDAALAALSQCLRLSADVEPAIGDLIHACESPEERREALTFLHQQLLDQPIVGDGLLAYHAWAENTLTPEELLAALRTLHTARPDLWQAWTALTRQLLAMRRREEALETAKTAVRSFPLVGRVWYELARAYDRPEAIDRRIAALKWVVRLSPDTPGVARELAELYANRGDIAQAQALIRHAIARDPVDAANQTFLAELLWKQGHRPAALARLERALRFDPAYVEAWQKYDAWSRLEDRPKAARQLARAVVEERTGDAQAWLALARMLDKPRFLPQRLKALDRAIALRPNLITAHDLKVTLLAEAQRYDEATAACMPEAFAAAPPLELRGRAAWIEACRGNLPAAIAAMQTLLKGCPHYPWGWQLLLEWLNEAQRDEELLAAIDQLRRVDPQNPVPYGYLGDIQLRRRQRAAARDTFEQALTIAPDYGFAASRLFDLYLEDGDYKQAERALHLLRKHNDSPRCTALEVLLNVKRDRHNQAMRALKRLCLTPEEDGWPNWAVEQTLGAGWQRGTRDVLEECLRDDAAPPGVGAAWARHFSHHLPYRACMQTLSELRRRGEIGWAAMAGYLENTAQRRRRVVFRFFLSRHRQELRSHVSTWHSVGSGWFELRNARAAARWFRNWRDYPQLTPAQLLDVALALRELDRNAEAAEVSQRALTAEPPDARWCHELWLAVDAVMAGDYAQAEERGARAASFIGDDPYYRFLEHALKAALANADGQPRDEAFEYAKAHLRQAVAACPSFRKAKPLLRTYRRCTRRIARQEGGVRGWLWGTWHLMMS